jgi:enoyl-CoA hydratase/carnithine racemase
VVKAGGELVPDDVRGAGVSDDEQPITYDVADSIGRITLNRPGKLNAINGALHRGLLGTLRRAAHDPEVRVVVLRGAGRAFSAGGDIRSGEPVEEIGDPRDIARAIWDLPKPVIAEVHGYCLGQGCEIAAVCDLTVAAESSTFGEVEVTHGWGPPILIAPYALSLKHAAEFLMLGAMVSASDALRIGLVNRVVPARRGDGSAGSTARLAESGRAGQGQKAAARDL